MAIRLLKANEIDLRVKTVSAQGNALLLAYKDARCDMAILDETFGAMKWKREHMTLGDRMMCTISVYDDERKQWVSKTDVGVESMTEKVKGEASDSFKRAGFNWGIGRELYTAPTMIIKLNPAEITKNTKGNNTTYARFFVDEIEYDENRKISYMKVVDKSGAVRFTHGESSKKKLFSTLVKVMEEKGVSGEQASAMAYEMFNESDSRKLNTEQIKELIKAIGVYKDGDK